MLLLLRGLCIPHSLRFVQMCRRSEESMLARQAQSALVTTWYLNEASHRTHQWFTWPSCSTKRSVGRVHQPGPVIEAMRSACSKNRQRHCETTVCRDVCALFTTCRRSFCTLGESQGATCPGHTLSQIPRVPVCHDFCDMLLRRCGKPTRKHQTLKR